MKNKLSALSYQTRKNLLTFLYALIFVGMVYKIVTAHGLYEMILFFIPAAYCIYAFFSTNARARFQQIKEYVHERCEPQAALLYMDRYPSLQKNKRFASALCLLRAYALIDNGNYSEAEHYITEEKKEVFSAPAAKPIAAYLLFNIAFLRKDKREVASAFAQLNENKSAFTLKSGQDTLSHTWNIAEANYAIIMGRFEQAASILKEVDLSCLKTHRETGYYLYSLSLALLGLGENDQAAQKAEQARREAPGIAAIKSL